MDVEVVAPEDYLGTVIGDLNARGAHIQNVGSRGAKSVVDARVPLKDMFGYSTKLRSVSQGRATFSMQFHAYDSLSS